MAPKCLRLANASRVQNSADESRKDIHTHDDQSQQEQRTHDHQPEPTPEHGVKMQVSRRASQRDVWVQSSTQMRLQDKAPEHDPREYFDCETDYFAEELQAQDDYSPTPEPALTQE